jgi:hypothetical protein
MTTFCVKSCGLLIIIAIILALVSVLQVPPVIPSAHASLHSEADDIRKCGNILQIWTNKSCERFNILKRLDDGRVGDQVVQPCKRGLLEITAYIISGGTLEEADAILAAKGCVQVWP